MKKNILIFLIALIVLISGLNQIALTFFLYWRVWWFDILMHFLGGLWIGLTTLWLYYMSGYIKKINKDKAFVFVLSVTSVLIIGIGWEVFEILIDPKYFQPGYIVDTTMDLIMDTIGALFAVAIIYFRDRKYL